MPETLQEFRGRTQGFSQHSLWETEGFTPNRQSLLPKVLDDGSGLLLPFYGSTTVFLLPPAVKQALRRLQDILYTRCGDMLAERLEADSFHITLHDLVSGPDEAALRSLMTQTRIAAVDPLTLCHRELAAPIRMQSTWAFNMNNTSVVLGFEPADEASCRRLMQMYEYMQRAVHLNYPLTPHVTLGYYRPQPCDRDALHRLDDALNQMNRLCRTGDDAARDGARIQVELGPQALVYQEFTDMNNYRIFV